MGEHITAKEIAAAWKLPVQRPNIIRHIMISVPMLPPRQLSPNASRRMHWGTRTKIRTGWQENVWAAALPFKDAMLTRAVLYITCVIKDRRSIMDTDNLLAACKPAIDVLTAKFRGRNLKRGDPGRQGLCIIADDSPEVLDIRLPVTWTVDKAFAPMTIFELYEKEN